MRVHHRAEKLLIRVIGADSAGDDEACPALLVSDMKIRLGDDRIEIHVPNIGKRKASRLMHELAGGLSAALGSLKRFEQRRIRRRQFIDQFLANCRIQRIGNTRITCREELLLLQLDAIPRRIAEDTVEATVGEDGGEYERPVEDAGIAADLFRGGDHFVRRRREHHRAGDDRCEVRRGRNKGFILGRLRH